MYDQPYAAKAIIQHEFDTDHLNIWLTFSEPMATYHKPDDSVWLCDIDGTITAVTSSAWQDSYTMLLVIDAVTSAPTRVLVSFDGPDGNLETSWRKNWEPWGYILSEDIGRLVEQDPVAMQYLNQSVKTNSTPEFAGLKLNPNASGGYEFTKWASATFQLALAQSESGQPFLLRLVTKDGDGTDFIGLMLCSKGNIADNNTNINYIFLGIDANGTYYRLNTGCTGTATPNLPIRIYAGTNTTQFILNLDGTISIGSYIDAVNGYKVGGTGPAPDGVYTTGYKLTSGGNNGTITIRGGIVVGITPAT